MIRTFLYVLVSPCAYKTAFSDVSIEKIKFHKILYQYILSLRQYYPLNFPLISKFRMKKIHLKKLKLLTKELSI